MDIGKIQLGPDASVDIALSGGNVVITVTVSAKPEVDALLTALTAKIPASLLPILSLAKGEIDAILT
jgi:hypothetical protein